MDRNRIAFFIAMVLFAIAALITLGVFGDGDTDAEFLGNAAFFTNLGLVSLAAGFWLRHGPRR